MTREKGEKASETAIGGGGGSPSESQAWVRSAGKQGPREAAPRALLTLRASEVRAGLPEESERAARLLRSPPRPGSFLGRPGGFPLLLRHPPCLSQVSGRTGSAAGSGRGTQGSARRWESLCGGVPPRSSQQSPGSAGCGSLPLPGEAGRALPERRG